MDFGSDGPGHELAFAGSDPCGHDVAGIDFMHGLVASLQQVMDPDVFYAQGIEVRDDKASFVVAGKSGNFRPRVALQGEEGDVVPLERPRRLLESLEQKVEMDPSRFGKGRGQTEDHGQGLPAV
jgi:hypothetical protein